MTGKPQPGDKKTKIATLWTRLAPGDFAALMEAGGWVDLCLRRDLGTTAALGVKTILSACVEGGFTALGLVGGVERVDLSSEAERSCAQITVGLGVWVDSAVVPSLPDEYCSPGREQVRALLVQAAVLRLIEEDALDVHPLPGSSAGDAE